MALLELTLFGDELRDTRVQLFVIHLVPPLAIAPGDAVSVARDSDEDAHAQDGGEV
jgi:hypothetical protein